MEKIVALGVRLAVAAGVSAATLSLGPAVAQADPWNPWIPGIPSLDGPGVNIGAPGNPLPPGQLKKIDNWIPGLGDLIPNFGKGKWK